MISGSITALVTPFRDGSIDERAFAAFVAWQIAEGTHGLVACGTTGEAPTLTNEEWQRATRICVEVADGRVPVIAGTGTNCTATTIERTRAAASAGADAALVVTPYYNRPTQEGLFRHFEAVALSCDLPIIVYNVPARCGVDLTPETLARLAAFPSVIGIKDATGDIERPVTTRRLTGSRFIQLSGDDRTALAFNGAGGCGCISVVANVVPRLCADLQEAWLRGDREAAAGLDSGLAPLVAALGLETNPVGVKFAMSLQRPDMSPRPRLPLVDASPASAAAIIRAWEALRSRAAAEPALA